MAKNTDELKDALQSHQQLVTTLTEQRDRARREHDETLMEHWTLSQCIRDLEQQLVLHHVADPTRLSDSCAATCLRDPACDPARRMSALGCTAQLRRPANALIHGLQREGDIIMTAMSTSIHSVRMHSDHSGYSNSRPCVEADYHLQGWDWAGIAWSMAPVT